MKAIMYVTTLLHFRMASTASRPSTDVLQSPAGPGPQVIHVHLVRIRTSKRTGVSLGGTRQHTHSLTSVSDATLSRL
jgi:hypothetical protein